jgi:hypothetical protein
MVGSDTIYMPLHGEGTDAWVPVSAGPFGHGFRRVRGPMPLGQLWAFPPGAVVAVTDRRFSSGDEALVAVESFGQAPPSCDELVKVRMSTDGRRRLCVFRRPDGLYQYRQDGLVADDDTSAYWREGYPLSGLYRSLRESLEDAQAEFRYAG